MHVYSALVIFIQLRWIVKPEYFIKWLAEMKAAGLARTDADCARLLDVSANAVVAMKKHGTDKRTDLACRALLHRMMPYGEG